MHAVAAHTTGEGSVAVKALSQVTSLGGLSKLVKGFLAFQEHF